MRWPLALAVVCTALALPPDAQSQTANFTQPTASNINDVTGQHKLASGTVKWQATDSKGNHIAFQLGGGGIPVDYQACATVVNGAITADCQGGTFQVATPDNTTPKGIYYQVTIQDAIGNTVRTLPNVTWSGSTFNLDTWIPATGAVPIPTNASIDAMQVGQLDVVRNLLFLNGATCTKSDGTSCFTGGGSSAGSAGALQESNGASGFQAGAILNETSPVAGQVLAYSDATHLVNSYAGVPLNQKPAGTPYTVQSSDRNKLILISGTGDTAVTLPQANTAGFTSNFTFAIKNIGTGTVTVTPTTSQVDGGASIAVLQGASASVYSDDTNYFTRAASGVITAGSNVTVTPTPAGVSIASTGSVNGSSFVPNNSGTMFFDPVRGSPDQIAMWDDFNSGAGAVGATNGIVGAQGWTLQSIGSCGSLAGQSSSATWPHVGVMRQTTPAVATQGCGLSLSPGSQGWLLSPGINANWSSVFGFKLGTAASPTSAYVGWQSNLTSATPTNFIGLRFDTGTPADAAFKLVTCLSGSCTVGATTYAVDANWHKLTISSTVAGTISIQLDGNAAQNFTTNIPTVALAPDFQVTTTNTTAVTMDVDFWGFWQAGLGR